MRVEKVKEGTPYGMPSFDMRYMVSTVTNT